jgi:hypothetical protein
MVVVNLKLPITVRVQFGIEGDSYSRTTAFTTKTFRAVKAPDTIPEPRELVPFKIVAIVVVDSSEPWFRLDNPILLAAVWSNVLSVQYEEGL